MQGVAENFIGVLRRDDQRAGRRIVKLAISALVLMMLAGLVLDLRESGRLVGPAVGYTLLALFAGTVLGLAWGWLKHYRLYDGSLRRNWNKWMRYSVACVSLAEIHRKVQGREGTSTFSLALALGALLFVSLVALFLSLLDGGIDLSGLGFFLLYGVLLGMPLGEAAVRKAWMGLFLRSIDDMVAKGKVDVWGVY